MPPLGTGDFTQTMRSRALGCRKNIGGSFNTVMVCGIVRYVVIPSEARDRFFFKDRTLRRPAVSADKSGAEKKNGEEYRGASGETGRGV